MDAIDAQRYDRGMWLLERFSLTRLRRVILAEARGAVLEVGAGTGANLPLYDAGLQVTAVELRPERLAAAARKARVAGRAAELGVAAADAHNLPFPAATWTIRSSRLGRNSWRGGSRVRMVTG